MGNFTEFICATPSDATIDLSKINDASWYYAGHYMYLRREDFKEVESPVSIQSFGEKASGKVYGYMTMQMKQAWENFSQAVSKKVVLYYMYEEGYPFRITLDPDNTEVIYEICKDSSWVKKLKASNKCKLFVETEYSGKIGIKKYLKRAESDIDWRQTI